MASSIHNRKVKVIDLKLNRIEDLEVFSTKHLKAKKHVLTHAIVKENYLPVIDQMNDVIMVTLQSSPKKEGNRTRRIFYMKRKKLLKFYAGEAVKSNERLLILK